MSNSVKTELKNNVESADLNELMLKLNDKRLNLLILQVLERHKCL